MYLFRASQGIRKDGDEKSWGYNCLVVGGVSLCSARGLCCMFRLGSTTELVSGSPLADGMSEATMDMPATSEQLSARVPTPG